MAVLLAASACTGDPTSTADPSAAAPSSGSAQPTSSSTTSSPPLQVPDLWTPAPSTTGKLHRLGYYGGPADGGGWASIYGVSSSTRLVAARHPESDRTGGGLTETTQVGWLVDTRPSTITAPAPPGPSQVVATDVHEDTFVWRDTRSTSLDIEDWRILAQSPEGGTDGRVIASYDDYYGADVVPMYNNDRHSLALVEDRAYWSIADWPTDAPQAPERKGGLYRDRPTYRILSTAVDGSGPIRQVALGAYGPARAGDRLLYIADDRLTTGRTSGTARVVATDGSRRVTIHRLKATSENTGIRMVCGPSSASATARHLLTGDLPPTGRDEPA